MSCKSQDEYIMSSFSFKKIYAKGTKHGLSEIQLDFVVYSFWTCQCHVDISIASSEGVGFDDDRADISVDRRRLETEK